MGTSGPLLRRDEESGNDGTGALAASIKFRIMTSLRCSAVMEWLYLSFSTVSTQNIEQVSFDELVGTAFPAESAPAR